MLLVLPSLPGGVAPQSCCRFQPAFPSRRAPPAAPTPTAAAAQPGTPPTVADAKAAFMAAFKKPLPAIYSTVVLELLVQQHLFRWNSRYQYSEVGAGCGGGGVGWVC